MTIDSRIVNSTVTRDTTSITKESFGLGFFLGNTTPLDTFTEKTRLYEKSDLTSIANMFGTDSEEYKATSKYFSQSPSAKKIRIGRREVAVAWVKKITFSGDIATGHTVNGTVNGEAIDEVAFDTSNLITMGLIADAIELIPGIASATVGGTGNHEITVTATSEYELSLTSFTVTGSPSVTATISTTTTGRTIKDDLIDCQAEIDDWYAVMIHSSNYGALLATAEWTETQKKQFIGHTSDSGVKNSTTTDIAAKYDSKNFTRSGLFWHQDTDEFIPAALFGRVLPIAPGSSRYAERELAGITVTPTSDLSSDEKNNVLNKKASVYIETGGRGVTLWATMANGDRGDTIRDLDYAESEIVREVFGVIIKNEKIAYTQDGIDIFTQQLQTTLNRLATEGIFDKSSIDVPRIYLSDTTSDDRADRKLTLLKWSARYTGGIESVVINGKVVV